MHSTIFKTRTSTSVPHSLSGSLLLLITFTDALTKIAAWMKLLHMSQSASGILPPRQLRGYLSAVNVTTTSLIMRASITIFTTSIRGCQEYAPSVHRELCAPRRGTSVSTMRPVMHQAPASSRRDVIFRDAFIDKPWRESCCSKPTSYLIPHDVRSQKYDIIVL